MARSLREAQFVAQSLNDKDKRDKPLCRFARWLLMVGITKARHRVGLARAEGRGTAEEPIIDHLACHRPVPAALSMGSSF